MNFPKIDPVTAFEEEKEKRIASYGSATQWRKLSDEWLECAFKQRYMYHFSWLGRPIIQLPADMVALQEIIWSVKPDLIIETGIAHGGSLVLSASMLALLDHADAVRDGTLLDPRNPRRRVLGIDIDIRAHNRAAIESHPLSSAITMIEGSSIDTAIIAQIQKIAAGYKTVLVLLDSNHTEDHVLAELAAYAPLASVGSYCVVYDTIIETLPDDIFIDRPWAKGNNSRTAVDKFLQRLQKYEFKVDAALEAKLLLSAVPGGFLKRIR